MTNDHTLETNWTALHSALPPMAKITNKTPWETRKMVQDALREDRIFLAYQPVVGAARPRRIAFYEGLLRIRDRNGRAILPGTFMPHLTGTPEALLVDQAVLRMALAALAEDPGLRLSLNVGSDAVADSGWIDILEGAAAQRADLAYRLIIEITEDCNLMERDDATAFLEKLSAIGCNVALDDFGAGATALSYLTRYRFDMLKLDGKLCRGLAGNADLQCLVTAMVKIAHHFEMMTVAEYISSEADAAMACRLGVDCLQGAYFGMAASMDVHRETAVLPALLGTRHRA